MNRLFFFSILMSINFGIHAQLLQPVQLPVIKPSTFKVYIATDGLDSQSGDSLSPVATFTAALSRASTLTNGLSGDQYGEIVFYPGTYPFKAAQPVSAFQLTGRKNHLSIRGIGNVVLDGSTLTNIGVAMIHLLGSNISVRNITVNYSDNTGVAFGQVGSGNFILSNDILVENVTVRLARSHGILLGKSPVNPDNPLAFVPRSERFHVKNCTVYESINFNTPQSQWGSCIKTHNTKHTTIEGCIVYNCEGEGINLDFVQSADIRNNVVSDTKAAIYLDKAEDIMVRNNLVYFTNKSSTGLLLGIEPFSWTIRDWFVRRVFISNNIILNTPTAFNLWQGTYGGLQVGFFTQIEFMNNTIIGKQKSNSGLINFTYGTLWGNPTSNVKLSQNKFRGNIISYSPDSLINNVIVGAPQNGPHSTSFGHNMWCTQPNRMWNASQDIIRTNLNVSVMHHQLGSIQPSQSSAFKWDVPFTNYITHDYSGNLRRTSVTNAGAFEWLSSARNTEQVVSETLITAYPNPSFDGIFRLQWDETPSCDRMSIMIFNANGQNILTERMTQVQEINISHEPKGVYLAVVTDQCSARNHVFNLVKQ